jgi:hypothetical protein
MNKKENQEKGSNDTREVRYVTITIFLYIFDDGLMVTTGKYYILYIE